MVLDCIEAHLSVICHFEAEDGLLVVLNHGTVWFPFQVPVCGSSHRSLCAPSVSTRCILHETILQSTAQNVSLVVLRKRNIWSSYVHELTTYTGVSL